MLNCYRLITHLLQMNNDRAERLNGELLHVHVENFEMLFFCVISIW